MKRKVNLVGVNTLTVSLPADWCSKYGIKKGDELDFLVKGKKIVVSPEAQKIVGETTIKIDTPKQFLKRLFHIPYILGYDKITVEYKDRSVANLIRTDLRHLMGFEMVQETDSFCVIKNVAKGIEEEFDTLFNGLIRILVQFHEDTLEAVKLMDSKKLKSVMQMDRQFTRFNLFSKRMLNKLGYRDEIKSKGMYAYCTLLEVASDNLKAICAYFLHEKVKPDKEIIDIMKLSLDHSKQFLKVYRKHSVEGLVELKRIRDLVFEKIDKKLAKKSSINPVLPFVYETVNMVHHATEEFR